MRETSKLLNNESECKINDYMCSVSTENNLKSENKDDLSQSANIVDLLYYLYASIFYCMATFFQQSVSPITDVLQNDLNISSSGIGMLSSSYFLTYLIFQIPFGSLLQHYSHHIILLIVSIGLSICFILFGFVESLVSAIIIRIFTGMLGAPTWLITMTLVGDHFGNNEVQFFAGVTTLFSFIIGFIGVTLQGYIYEEYTIWRETYYVLGSIGIVNVCVIIITMYVQTKRLETQTVTVMPISNQDDSQHSNKLKLVITNYLNWCLGMFGFAQFTIFSSFYGLWLIPYLMLKFHFTRSQASFSAGIGIASIGIGTLLFGYFSSKFKKRKIFLLLSILLESTLFYLLYLNADLLNEYIIFTILIITALGVGSITILFTLIREYNYKYKTEETATGFVNCVMVSSGLISQYVIGLLIDYNHNRNNINLINGYQGNDVSDYQFAFSCVIPACLGVAIISTILLKETNASNI